MNPKYLLVSLVRLIFSLGSGVLVARTLGPEIFGFLAIFLLATHVTGMLARLGFEAYILKFLSDSETEIPIFGISYVVLHLFVSLCVFYFLEIEYDLVALGFVFACAIAASYISILDVILLRFSEMDSVQRVELMSVIFFSVLRVTLAIFYGNALMQFAVFLIETFVRFGVLMSALRRLKTRRALIFVPKQVSFDAFPYAIQTVFGGIHLRLPMLFAVSFGISDREVGVVAMAARIFEAMVLFATTFVNSQIEVVRRIFLGEASFEGYRTTLLFRCISLLLILTFIVPWLLTSSMVASVFGQAYQEIHTALVICLFGASLLVVNSIISRGILLVGEQWFPPLRELLYLIFSSCISWFLYFGLGADPTTAFISAIFLSVLIVNLTLILVPRWGKFVSLGLRFYGFKLR